MKLSNLFNESNNSNVTVEHVKGGLDSYYQLTKAKELAKADGHDYDKLPEYHRGKDQPHKEKYKALAKEVNEVSVPYSKSTEKDLADRIAKKDDEKKRVKKSASKSLKDYKKKMKSNDDWKDTAEGLVGNVAGSLAGSVAGSVAGPGGSLAGGVAGGMAGDKLGDLVKKKLKASQQDDVDLGPTWEDDLEAALDGYPEWAHEYIKDGVCPECGGNGYMDGDYENEDGEENDECNGMYEYDCDEGEIRDNTWADELKSKEPQAPKQPAPSKEQIMKLLPMLHKEYVQSGRYNAFELGSILKQMYPELNKREAGSYVADFLSNYKPEVESIEEAEKSIEDCIRQTLEKEGGAAGKGAIVDACKEAGYSEEECSDAMSKMSDVKEHEHGDYILEVTEGLYDEGENADTQTNEEEELNNLRKRAGLEVKEVIEDDYEYENDLAMEFVKLPLASMSKEEIRREMSSIFNTLYQMGMGDEPQTDAGVAMEDLGTSVEDSGHYVNDDWTYPSEGEISDEDVQTMIEHQQKVKDVLSQEGDSQYEEAIEEGVYANYVTYVGPNGEELGTEDYDGELEPDMMAQMASDEECKMLCDKHNMDYNDTIGCLKFDDGEATMQDGEELPDGTIAFYGGKEATEESAPVEFDNDSNEAHVAKMLAKALGDENRWSEMSAVELYAELESQDPDVADMLHKVAMTIYDIKLKERVYKNQGTSDAVTDTRGKDFQFDKSNKKFKSLDGEEAAVNTKLGKDLLRRRRNQMKRTNPSYPKNKA
tara:strand:- start:7063 stop:9354 length:2292 start_codon:yes stop_codon:yes gene_type:complete